MGRRTQRGRVRSAAAVAGVLVALLGVASSDDGEPAETGEAVAETTTAPTTPPVAVPTRTEVEHLTLDLVDPSRATPWRTCPVTMVESWSPRSTSPPGPVRSR